MSEEYNALCSICGKPYKICRTCRDSGLFSWKTVTDSIDCFKVYTILHQYNVLHDITENEAKQQLLDCHIDEQIIKDYPDNVKKSILGILSTKTTVEKTNKNMTENKSESKKRKTVVKKTKTNE